MSFLDSDLLAHIPSAPPARTPPTPTPKDLEELREAGSPIGVRSHRIPVARRPEPDRDRRQALASGSRHGAGHPACTRSSSRRSAATLVTTATRGRQILRDAVARPKVFGQASPRRATTSARRRATAMLT